MIYKASDPKLTDYLKTLGDKEVEVKVKRKTRTSRQNAALHLWFTQLSNELNEHGFDMKTVIKDGIDLMWTPYLIKEFLFRPTFKMLTKKTSTNQLDTKEINDCFDIINKAIGERTAIHIPFPCMEEMLKNLDN